MGHPATAQADPPPVPGTLAAGTPTDGVTMTGRARLAGGLLLGGAVVAARAVGAGLATAGASDREVDDDLPGDDLVPDADLVTTRARTVAAPPSQVWPWLVQMGWGRAGWYSLDAVEALVGAARSTAADGSTSWRSLHELVPAHQRLAVGDVVPLSARTGFRVERLAPRRHLVLGLRAGGGAWSFGWSWAFVLREDPAGTRLVVRTRVAADPWPAAVACAVLVDPGHAVMELVQLRNLARRAERTAVQA